MNTEENAENLSEIEKQIKKFYDNMPADHKQILEDYNNKISQILQQVSQQNPYEHLDNDEPLDLSKKHPEILHPKHLTNAPHEILVYVKAEVSSIDNNGNLSEVKDLCEQYYHIPIPSNIDYNIYMHKFFEKFHANLELSSQEIQTEKKDV